MNFKFNPVMKYRNVKQTMDGHTFDSKKELAVYEELKEARRTGEIVSFTMQERFELIPAQYENVEINGKLKKKCVERAIYYVADFVVVYPDGEKVVLDPKGKKTEVYKIKKKLMLMFHKIAVKEV